MYVEHFPYEPAVNASEELACKEIQSFLRSRSGDGRFALLTNLAYSINSSALPDEIDLVIVGSTGVSVVEIKHWDRSFRAAPITSGLS
jgi:nuclease-like protein